MQSELTLQGRQDTMSLLQVHTPSLAFPGPKYVNKGERQHVFGHFRHFRNGLVRGLIS